MDNSGGGAQPRGKCVDARVGLRRSRTLGYAMSCSARPAGLNANDASCPLGFAQRARPGSQGTQRACRESGPSVAGLQLI